MLEHMPEIFSLFLHNLRIDIIDCHKLLDLVVYCGDFHGDDGINHVARHSVLDQKLPDAPRVLLGRLHLAGDPRCCLLAALILSLCLLKDLVQPLHFSYYSQ